MSNCMQLINPVNCSVAAHIKLCFACISVGAIAVEKAYFGQGEVHIFLDEVACTGNETSLLHCSGTDAGLHNCYHVEDAGVVCPGLYLL